MNNERCSYHSANSKGFRSSVSGAGDENSKCISYCITISFPHKKRYYLLLQNLNHLKKSSPKGITPSSVYRAPPVLADFPLLSPRCLVIWRQQTTLSSPNPLYSFRHSEIYFSVLNVLSSPPLLWWDYNFPLPLHSSGKTLLDGRG